MNRRDALALGAATSLAHLLSNVVGCAAQTAAAQGGSTVPVAPGDARAAWQRAAAECARAGEACIAHCIASLSTGSTVMADCLAKARVMVAICHAAETVATTESAHLAELARLCIATCEDCATACAPHAEHHAVCGDCMRACRATIDAARAVAG